MEIFNKIQEALFKALIRYDLDMIEIGKRVVGIFMYLIIVPVIFLFGLYHFGLGNRIISAVLFSCIVFLTVLYYLIYKIHSKDIIFFRILAFFFVFFNSCIVIFARLYNTHMGWVIIFPLFTFFILEKREGLIWSIVYLFFMISFALVYDPVWYSAPIKIGLIIRISLISIVIITMTYVYQSVIQYYYDRMLQEGYKLMAEREKLTVMARTDFLTKLFNRNYISDCIAYEKDRSRRSGKAFALIMGDIDDFKSINDAHGHACGDQVLIRISSIMREIARKQDYVGRWGGEEFLMLLPETDKEGAGVLAEKIRSEVQGEDFICGNSKLSITLSFGVCSPESGEETIEVTIARADKALYRAKKSGKNRVVSI